jgi:hypothetical protein
MEKEPAKEGLKKIFVIEYDSSYDPEGKVIGAGQTCKRQVEATSLEEAQALCNELQSERVAAGPFDRNNAEDMKELEEWSK